MALRIAKLSAGLPLPVVLSLTTSFVVGAGVGVGSPAEGTAETVPGAGIGAKVVPLLAGAIGAGESFGGGAVAFRLAGSE